MIKKYIKNKKSIFIISIILIILIVPYIFHFVCKQNEKIQIETFNLNIKSIYNSNEIISYKMDSVILYNNIMIPLDVVVKDIFGREYNEEKEKIIIEVQDKKYIINQEENIIQIPNEYDYKGNILDNSTTIEIENINDKRYIPIYFIANIPGATVLANGKKLYESTDYISSSEIILKNKNNNLNIQIEISKNTTGMNRDYSYWGQKKGALWREEAYKRIEKYRKKNIMIHVVNHDSKKEPKTKINIKMMSNSFDYGTSIAYDKNLQKNIFGNLNLFSVIGSENGFKWKVYQDTNYVQEIMECSKKNSKKVRGHNLWWDYICSDELDKLVGKADKFEDGSMADIYYKNKSGELNEYEKKFEINRLKEKFKEIVINHIIREISDFNDIKEWDVINGPLKNQYFKYYLFEEKFLEDDTFLKENFKIFDGKEEYKVNEEYSEFLAKCIDTLKNKDNNNKAIVNDNIITDNASNKQIENTINLLNSISKYTNNKFSYGIQYHVYNNYNNSIQNYYNMLNKIKSQTKIEDIVITEYDNVLSSKNRNYTSTENDIRADYLKDSLIMAYSNPNISEFTMWVYYSDHFCDEERKAYEETVYPWLNYSEEGTTTEEGYSTRLYKGTYTATVTLPNGKTKDVEFTVSDDTSDTVEVIIDSEITDVKIKQQPSKIKYYRNDNIDLTDGVLEISYDDGTTKELAMNDSNINIAGFDSSVLGKQTIKLNYKGHEITFEIEIEENQDDLIKNSIQNIESGNIKLKNNYNYISNNIEILNSYNSIISKINELKQNIKNIDNSKINELYKSEFDLASKIIDEYNKKTINISEEDLKNVLNDITELTSNYTELYKYYFNNDTIDNEQITNNINELIDRYNYNKDIELPLELYYINQVKDIYNNSITGQNNYENYLNKRRIQNTCTIISKILENKIKETAQKESQTIGITYNTNLNTLTNKDVIAQIKLPNSKSSIESNPNNEKYTFTENGTKNITINIRGYKYNYNIKVTNIDKTPPQITGIEQDGKYKEGVTPQITDANLTDVKLTKDGQEVENYKQNTSITQEGIYQLKATDKAGNETSINFVIAYPEDEKYKIENNTIKNIKGETSVETFKGKLQVDEKYTIKRKDTEIQNSENIATGDILETESGNKYTLIVRGDINKDGKVDIKDLVKMRKFLLLGNNLDESEEMAADTNIDGKEISIKDLVKMRIILLTQ